MKAPTTVRSKITRSFLENSFTLPLHTGYSYAQHNTAFKMNSKCDIDSV